MVRGLTVCGCAKALRKNRLDAEASRLAESRKSIVWPRLSTARYIYTHLHPQALHLDVCLIDPPRAIARTQMWPDPLLQFLHIGLDPAKKGCVILRGPTV